MLKTCFKCKLVLPRTAFYRHGEMGDGLLGKCKECTKRDVRENYRANRGHYKAYDRQRQLTLERRTKVREYRERMAPAVKRAQRKYIERHPEKRRAHVAVGNAVRDGRLKREPCEACGTDVKVHAHHDDYSKPLEVRWLCADCHVREHGGVPTADLLEKRP